mgnify:FL=1
MSGAKWLLDTNVVIGLLKKRSAAIALAESNNLDLHQAAVSQITRMELLGFPSLGQEEEAAILDFLSHCRVMFVDDVVEQRVIRLRRTVPCKLPDAIIAATAQIHQLTLLTLDQRLEKLAGQIVNKTS